MIYTKLSNLIHKYRAKETRSVQNVVRTKGIPCVVQLTQTSLENHDTDPFSTDISKLDRQYATNTLTGATADDKIFFLGKLDTWIDINFEESFDDRSMRNDYIAYFEVGKYEVGDIVSLNDIPNSKYVIHRIYKHREKSDIVRYLLSKEF